MGDDAFRGAVNFAILAAHRLGEPRVLELSPDQVRELARAADPLDWSPGPAARYRDLRVAETEGSIGRVLAWDRAREMDMAQRIHWPRSR